MEHLNVLSWIYVLQESMRLQPVVATPLQRVAKGDIRLSNGVVIPSGVTIDLAQFTVMHDEAWGWKDSKSFVPVNYSFHPMPLTRLCKSVKHLCMQLYPRTAYAHHLKVISACMLSGNHIDLYASELEIRAGSVLVVCLFGASGAVRREHHYCRTEHCPVALCTSHGNCLRCIALISSKERGGRVEICGC